MAVTEFDKKNLGVIRKDVDEALKGVGAKHGITLALGRITYTATDFRGKLEAIIPNGKVDGGDPYKAILFNELQKYGSMYGLSAADHGKIVNIHGVNYKFLGIKSGARKSPLIMLKMSNQKMYRFSDDNFPVDVIALIKKAKAPK